MTTLSKTTVSLSGPEGTLLTVVDETYPQYSGRYILNAAQAAGIRGVVEDQDIEVIRDWLDDHGGTLTTMK